MRKARVSFSLGLVRRVAAACLFVAGSAHAENIVVNPSFELGSFANTSCNYMQLDPGATALTGWSVGVEPAGWGRNPTCDGNTAFDGASFIDLNRFVPDSTPNTTISQTVPTIAGTQYTFRIARQGGPIDVTLSGSLVPIPTIGTSGPWIISGSTITALFTNAELVIETRAFPAQGALIDDVQLVPIPLPGTLPLILAAFGSVITACRRRRPIPIRTA